MSSALRIRKTVSTAAVSALIAGALVAGGGASGAVAQQATGTAPFLNSWLVSGPFDTPVAEEIYGIDRPAGGNWASVATATASSTWTVEAAAFPGGTPAASFGAAKAIDGDLATNWVSQMHNNAGDPATWPAWDPAPKLTLAWSTPITVKSIEVFDRFDASWPANTSDVQRVDYTLRDAAGASLGTGSITTIDPTGATPGVKTLTSPVTGVSKVELLIVHDSQKTSKNIGLGFKEVRVLDGLGDGTGSGAVIAPSLGEELDGGKVWEYFDDRLWNRNYDDYQDLHGYYAVKKGIDTRNKYVYAASYVYSPTERDVEFRYGSSGAHRLFVNDVPVGGASTPAEVHKDMTVATVHLEAGWNTFLLQMKHTFTDDVASNGKPAQDSNVAYLGFYGRVTDASGNAITDLEYSVRGTGTPLAIETRALAATDVASGEAPGRGLPSNVLPTGYQEWPYVWNTSEYDDRHNVSASKFRFLAGGGAPGYTWSVASGALPAGLTLNADGTVDGNVEAAPGEYTFSIRVTDSASATTTKSFTMKVKERPNRWFELGRVSGLSHTITTYNWFVDPEYSADLWAQRAFRQGHSLVAVETMQQNYYWPSKFADPQASQNQYLPTDASGKIVDGIKPFEEAVKRYGMKFGLYYASNGGAFTYDSSDVLVQNVEDLIHRYDPDYLYFDGPQIDGMPNENFDAMYSSVRNYGDDILINANAWGTEYGDVDLRTSESHHIFQTDPGSKLNKRTTLEPWKSIISKNSVNPYYGQRDDYRFVVQEMVQSAGLGIVNNNDQMPLFWRGPDWNTPEQIATMYPGAVQENIDIRENVAAWFAPPNKPERHESITGTEPYFLTNPTYTDDGKGNVAQFEKGQGPAWGYATARDNNIYLHIIVGPNSKQGVSGNSLTISPVDDTVLEASFLNEDQPLEFTQTGNSVTIDLTGVQRDPVDTIVKLVTDSTEREFTLTDVVATGEQKTPSTLQVGVEGHLRYPALKAQFDNGAVTYSSSNTAVATVNSSGLVTAVGNGAADITVNGTYEGVTKSDVLKVKVAGGKVYVKDTMIGASMWVEGRETYGEFSSFEPHDFRLEGRSAQGGAIGLDAATVTMKAGVVNLAGGTKTDPISIQESNIVTFANGKAIPTRVMTKTRVAVWAEVTLDGQTVTTNKVFMDLMPYQDMAQGSTVTASGSSGTFTPDKVIDGKTLWGTSYDSSRWSVSGTGASWIAFDLGKQVAVDNVEIDFNSKSQLYYNTPKKIEIQTSQNGTTWTTVSTVTPPTPSAGAFFGYATSYPVGAGTRHIRLNFPTGGNSASIDLQEVKINGSEAPVLNWKLDELSGTTAADSSAKVNNGTISGPAAHVVGRVGNALELNGSSTVVTSSALATTKTDNLTMSAWVKWDGATSDHQMIVYNGHSAFDGYGLMLNQSNGNRVTILVGGVAFVSSQETLTADRWTHVAAIRKNGTWSLYLDGQSATLSAAGSVPKTPTGLTRAGGTQSSTGYFNGIVDEVSIYDTPWTESQVTAAARFPSTFNVAPWSTATASSATTGGEAAKAVDGVIAQSTSGSWTATAADAAPSVTLTWADAIVTDRIALYDLPGSSRATSGKLTFSDGTSVTVPALADDGTANLVAIPRKAITWAKFEVLTHTGTAGLSEFQVIEAVPDLATAAVATASTAASGAGAGLVIDGAAPSAGGGWKATAADTAPSVTLTWPSPRSVDRVVLYDRAGADHVTGGTLVLSDGTTIPVGALPDGGGAHVVAFPDKALSWVRFEITGHTGDAGLAEVQAYDLSSLAPSATVTGSSMYNANYTPANVIDGRIGVSGSGEWAIQPGDSSRTVRLTWASSQIVSGVTLYDRPNAVDQVTSGVLRFSDGTTVNVAALPSTGAAQTIAFPARNATWVEFSILTFTGTAPGLSEMQVN